MLLLPPDYHLSVLYYVVLATYTAYIYMYVQKTILHLYMQVIVPVYRVWWIWIWVTIIWYLLQCQSSCTPDITGWLLEWVLWKKYHTLHLITRCITQWMKCSKWVACTHYVHIFTAGSEGVKAEYMRSAYPTKTFPNHFTIVTVRNSHIHRYSCIHFFSLLSLWTNWTWAGCLSWVPRHCEQLFSW